MTVVISVIASIWMITLLVLWALHRYVFGRWKFGAIVTEVVTGLLALTVMAWPESKPQQPQYSPDIIAVDPVSAADIENLRAARDDMRDRVRDRIEAYHAGL